MRDTVLWRKQSHIIMMLADTLDVDLERAMDIFYTTETSRQLSNPDTGLQLMSDQYILENILAELRRK